MKDVWTPVGLILGFQVTLLSWRIQREAGIGDKGDLVWLTPSDYVGLLGILVLVLGAFVLPLAGAFSIYGVETALGLGVMLFVGQVIGLCAHYQLFGRSRPREHVWFPIQEQIVVGLVVLISSVYLTARS